MKELVPDEILQATNKCSSDHSCLSNASPENGQCCHGCDVEFVVGKNLMFVKPTDERAHLCPYKMHYGSGIVCQCPVRYYLFLSQPNL